MRAADDHVLTRRVKLRVANLEVRPNLSKGLHPGSKALRAPPFASVGKRTWLMQNTVRIERISDRPKVPASRSEIDSLGVVEASKRRECSSLSCHFHAFRNLRTVGETLVGSVRTQLLMTPQSSAFSRANLSCGPLVQSASWFTPKSAGGFGPQI